MVYSENNAVCMGIISNDVTMFKGKDFRNPDKSLDFGDVARGQGWRMGEQRGIGGLGPPFLPKGL